MILTSRRLGADPSSVSLSSVLPPSDQIDVDDSDDDFGSSELVGSVKMIDSEFDDSDLVESDTLWQDKITSVVRTGNFHLTQKVNTIRIEYILPGFPSIWPILRTCTVFVINLDDPKYIIRDPQTGDFYTIDTLIQNADNDSWKSGVVAAAAPSPKSHLPLVRLPSNAGVHLPIAEILLRMMQSWLPKQRHAEMRAPQQSSAFHLYMNRLTKPLLERYIHSYITNADGGICILTCVPFLLKLLNDPGVVAFDDDTTYKRVEGKMNEWELTIFAKVVLCAASVVFNELQQVKLMIMGKPMPVKAQIIGICRSVMKYNVSEYSGIPNDTPPEKVAPHFVKICWRHSKEPVHNFRSLVSQADHAHLLNFNLGVKKIQDWWAHKQMHEWIIPCLVKSQSLIPANVWDSTPSTTNTNEAQHHWTNSLTGIKLSLVEGLESARNADETVAHEIQASMRTGILTNPNNKVVHRMARNVQRASAMAGKARESQEQSDAETRLKGELAEELEARWQ
ncbi:hypothetical protein B0H10DRAFT_2220970 [Mycena sp. CBHHK59/15]|nr:hypothetical protein B0H10DRAFT_2220970 [Mycena sp. CBHHK59/15]